MRTLPAAGRDGPTPDWPLGEDIVTRAKLQIAENKVVDLANQLAAGAPVPGPLTRAKERVAELQAIVAIQHNRELELWQELWRLPQAIAWEQTGWTREVAGYVRWTVLGEAGDLNAAKEARQLSDRLGLSPLAMLRLRWEIIDQPPGSPTTDVVPIHQRREHLTDTS
jgi:hypothetical protein